MKSSVKTKRTELTFPKSVTIRVGILDGDARYESDEEGEASSVGEVAEQHEFGLGVPQRSWLRGWYDGAAAGIKTLATEQFRQAAMGDGDFQTAASRVAFMAEASIKARITDDKPFKKLSPVTEAKRRGGPPYTPLVDTEVFISSIAADAEVT